MSTFRSFLVSAAAGAGFLASSAPAAQQTDPYDKPDDAWISISGTVDSVSADEFVLDYGDGTIVVEMDDGDRDGDAYKLLPEDKVTVNGRVDDDFLELRTIEAGSVYVEKLGTTFYASAVDEEDNTWVIATTPIIVSTTVLEGTVGDVSDDEFQLEVGSRSIEVEVEEMPYNPLDDKGYQRITKGDRVRVTGSVDYDLFEGYVFDARTAITLRNRQAMKSAGKKSKSKKATKVSPSR